MSGVNEEPNNPSSGDQEAHITLKVIDQNGNEMFFRMKRSTRLNKLMNAYNIRRPNLDGYVFMYDGCRLKGYWTPDELEMEDGDEIDALLHMYSGRYDVLNETGALLETEKGDGINAYIHQTEDQRVCYDEPMEEDIAREEELIKEEELARNKLLGILWRVVSKLIAENSVLKDELKRLARLTNDEEEDVVFMNIGRIVCKLTAGNSPAKEELKEKLTRVKDELREELTTLMEELMSILEDDEEDGDEYDFIEEGRFISEVVEWGKKNKDVLRWIPSRL